VNAHGTRTARELTLAAMVADQRGFIIAAAVVGLGRLLTPSLAGAEATWLLIGALWLVGALLAAWQSRRQQVRELVGRVGVQNLAVQLLVALPAVAVGTWRLVREAPGEGGAAFLANAAVTVIAVPLLSATVLTMAGLLVAVPAWKVVGGRRQAAELP
jgi:hypothetical protein